MKTYLGIELAGDNGNTGVAEILETPEGLFYQFPAGSWRGHDGLGLIEGRSRAAEMTALLARVPRCSHGRGARCAG